MRELKEKLRAAKAEVRIRERQLNAAKRGYERALNQLGKVEDRIELHMAKLERQAK